MPNKKKQDQFFQPPTLQDVYERDIAKQRHNCTDVLCLIIFIIFGIVQLCLTLVVFIKGGDPRTFLLPHDSSGKVCTGSTPNLFFFNLAACLNVNALVGTCPTPTICVSTCPSQNLFYLIDSQRTLLYSNYCDSTKLLNYFNGQQIPGNNIDSNTYAILVSNQICPAYALASSAFYSRCIPTVITSVLSGVTNALTASDSSTNTTMNISDSQNNSITDQTINSAAQYVISLLNLNTIANYIIDDLTKSAVLIGVLLGIASVASFIYIVIMRWVIAPMVYLTLLILIGGLSFVIYYCANKYITLKNVTNTTSTFQFSSDINYYFTISYTWLVIACITALILLIVLLLLIVMFKRLRLAIQLICEASRAVCDTFITIIFPVIPLLLELGFLVYFAATAIFLACNSSAIYKIVNTNTTSNNNSTSNNGTTSSSSSNTCDPNVSLTNTNGFMCLFYAYGNYANQYLNVILSFLSKYQWLPQVYNLFMFFWTEFFLIGLNQMILAGCYGIWYWSQGRSSCILLTSIKDTFVYHLGSIAFGSLILALVQIIRVLIQYVQNRVKNTAGNNSITRGLIKFISCCCMCCFYCLDKVLKFINRNAYIMVAIYGRNFCKSAMDALQLIVANPLRTLVLNGVTGFILFLGSLLITIGTGVLAFYFFTKSFYIDPSWTVYFAPNLHYFWAPLIVVVIGAFVISRTFLYVFEMAVDTVFLCAMKDLSIHDGTPQKPYYMSKNLLRILNVKNERSNRVAPL